MGYCPPHARLTLRPTLLPVVVSRFALDARPRPGMIASEAGGEIARTPSRQKATHSTLAHAIFSLTADIPHWGLGGMQIGRKGAVAIGVADLFCGGIFDYLKITTKTLIEE